MRTAILMVLLVTLFGCSTTKTTYLKDNLGNPVQVVEDRGWFASENLAAHYDFESKRSDNHVASVNAKITAIKENIAARMTTVKMTPTEAMLSSVIDQMTLAAIPVDPPAPGKAPKTMVDVADGQLTNWLRLGLDYAEYNRDGKNQQKNDGDDLTILNYGKMGDVNSKSKNRTGTLSLDGQSQGYMDLSSKKGGEKDESESEAEE
jgi:hypothetical protein